MGTCPSTVSTCVRLVERSNELDPAPAMKKLPVSVKRHRKHVLCAIKGRNQRSAFHAALVAPAVQFHEHSVKERLRD